MESVAVALTKLFPEASAEILFRQKKIRQRFQTRSSEIDRIGIQFGIELEPRTSKDQSIVVSVGWSDPSHHSHLIKDSSRSIIRTYVHPFEGREASAKASPCHEIKEFHTTVS